MTSTISLKVGIGIGTILKNRKRIDICIDEKGVYRLRERTDKRYGFKWRVARMNQVYCLVLEENSGTIYINSDELGNFVIDSNQRFGMKELGQHDTALIKRLASFLKSVISKTSLGSSFKEQISNTRMALRQGC